MISAAWIMVAIISAAFLRFLFRGAPPLPTRKEVFKSIAGAFAGKSPLFIAELGSGDGRIVALLAKEGHAVEGFETNPLLAWWSRMRLNSLKIGGRAVITRADFWKTDLSRFGGVYIFGARHIMSGLEKKLSRELKPGCIVVSNAFPLPSWIPEKKERGLYMYKVPSPA